MAEYSVMAADGQAYGPVDEAGMVQWVREGRVNAATNIRCEPGGQVVPAGSLPFLAASLGSAAAPPLPQAPVAAGYPQVVAPGSPQARMHTLDQFSAGVAVLLQYVTFGIFPLIWLGLMHDKMPKLRHDDPSAGKAIGFMFIPFFNIYWMFFHHLRLCDRINEQRTFHGLAPTAPRGLALGAGICTLIPYVNIVAGLILWPIYIGLLQARVNELVYATAAGTPQQ